MVRFAHLSDCHIGGWREEKMRQLSISSFDAAVRRCIQEKVDFILIAGDLFNTSVPSIDALKMVASGMKKLQEHGICIYVIPGSHDYSPSGKTMLEVLEKSGLCTNVFKFDREKGRLEFTIDKRTGVKLSGMVGLRGGLEKFDYMKLDKSNLENEKGLKIFLFHSLITEFKPMDFEMIDSEPLMSLPKHFAYYAGGHPHFVFKRDMKKDGYGIMTYPGPLLPNNFKELEKLKHGGFYIVDMNETTCDTRHVELDLRKVMCVEIDAEGKSAVQVDNEIKSALQRADAKDAIVTLRVEGCLSEGKTTDIHFKELFDKADAFLVLKNTGKLTTKELAEVNVDQGSVSDVEEHVLREHLDQFPVSFFGFEKGFELGKALLGLFDKEKLEGERASDFEERLFADAVKELNLSEVWKRAD